MSDEDGPRTFGIWGLVGLFVLLTVAGLVALIVVGSPSGPTVTLPTSPPAPDDGGASATGDPPAGSTTTPPGSATFPDGRPTPDGVVEVLVADGSTALTFAAPDGVDLATFGPVVPATSASVEPDGISLRIRAACAVSSEEFLAQVSITESEAVVSVLAVALAPPAGPECAPDQATEVVVQLIAPVGSRTLAVAPAGTSVPGG